MRFGHPSPEQLSRHIDGMLGPKQLPRVESHLAGCGACKLYVGALKDVRTQLGGLPTLVGKDLPEPSVPQFIPVPQPVFSLKAVALGLAAGMMLMGGGTLWFTSDQPAKVISSSRQVINSEGVVTEQVQSGASVRTLIPENIDLELPNKVLIRMRPGTTMTWQQVRRPLWMFAAPPLTVVNVMHGEILARTQDGFWGSNLEVRTPSANATVKGTAFSVKVDEAQEGTTLKVLAGTVFLSPYLGKVGVDVEAGHESRVPGAQRLPKLPKALSSQDRKALLETYRIGNHEPSIELVLGAGPERLEELFQPALLYIGKQTAHPLQATFERFVKRLNTALLEGQTDGVKKDLRILEHGLKTVSGAELAVPLRLYVGAYYASLGEHYRAQFHFQKAADIAPGHPLASLAWAAVAQMAQDHLGDSALAQSAYLKILNQYPHSPEAVLAKKVLNKS